MPDLGTNLVNSNPAATSLSSTIFLFIPSPLLFILMKGTNRLGKSCSSVSSMLPAGANRSNVESLPSPSPDS
jgi:hypothetical protein